MTEKHEAQSNATDRNSWLKKELERGVTPIADFEVAVLRDNFQALASEQSRNAVMLGESMQDSSETWHDNAAAEMINAASFGLSSQAGALAKIINEVPLCEIPNSDHEVATLGSIIFVLFDDTDDTPEPFLLTGVTNDLPSPLQDQLPQGCEAVTLRSPLGIALLGCKSGDSITYQANGRDLTVHIHHIAQL